MEFFYKWLDIEKERRGYWYLINFIRLNKKNTTDDTKIFHVGRWHMISSMEYGKYKTSSSEEEILVLFIKSLYCGS